MYAYIYVRTSICTTVIHIFSVAILPIWKQVYAYNIYVLYIQCINCYKVRISGMWMDILYTLYNNRYKYVYNMLYIYIIHKTLLSLTTVCLHICDVACGHLSSQAIFTLHPRILHPSNAFNIHRCHLLYAILIYIYI